MTKTTTTTKAGRASWEPAVDMTVPAADLRKGDFIVDWAESLDQIPVTVRNAYRNRATGERTDGISVHTASNGVLYTVLPASRLVNIHRIGG